MKNSEKIVKNLQKGIAVAEASDGSLVTISLREARKLLNMLQHQPYLLTLEEANENEIVYIELKDQKELFVVTRFEYQSEGNERKPAWLCPSIRLDGVTYLADEETYGKEVRYWSERPSEELSKKHLGSDLMLPNPCHGCTERTATCHPVCGKYKTYQEKKAEEKRLRQADNEVRYRHGTHSGERSRWDRNGR